MHFGPDYTRRLGKSKAEVMGPERVILKSSARLVRFLSTLTYNAFRIVSLR